jgi:hypothetical protein
MYSWQILPPVSLPIAAENRQMVTFLYIYVIITFNYINITVFYIQCITNVFNMKKYYSMVTFINILD